MLMLPLLLTMMVAPTFQSPLKILDTPDGGTRPDPCALICFGIGRWNETGYYQWVDSASLRNFPWRQGKAIKIIDISGCNFESRPVIKATIRSVEPGDCPSVAYHWISNYFPFFFTIEDITGAEMKSKKCDIYWSAYGYDC